jgi:hypothetical protein
MKTLKLWIIASAVVGSAISFSSIYAFHLLSLLWIVGSIYYAFLGKKIIVQQSKLLFPIVVLAIYTFISILWHPNILVWTRYQFYIFCGLLSIMSVYQYAVDVQTLYKVFYVLSTFLLINLLIGVFESFDILRLPTSRYSPYAQYFGYVGIDQTDISKNVLAILSKKPTGFYYNPNSFGFVMLLASPFILFHKKLFLKGLGILIVFWLLANIGSRSLFLAFLILVILLPIYSKLTLSKTIRIMTLPIGLLCVFLLPNFFDFSSYSTVRMFSAFDQLLRGLRLLFSGEINPVDSTSTRASIYIFGIKQLIQSYGLGVGFGGIEALLIRENFQIQSFHFLFLQLLVDLGIIIFSFLFFWYTVLIWKLYKISFKSDDSRLAYYARATSLSLIIAIPASVAPSGVHYILTFYLLIGFALSILKIYNLENFNENSIACCS